MLGRTAAHAAAAATAAGPAAQPQARRCTVLLALSPWHLTARLRHTSAAASGTRVSGGGRRQVVVWAAAAAGAGAKGAGVVAESGRAGRGPGSRASNPGQPVVVVVESPTKAKKIQGFLGDNYKVLASYGHVRDLPPRDGSVRPPAPAEGAEGAAPGAEAEAGGDEGGDWQLQWALTDAAKPRMAEIAGAATGAPLLVLATDPDREGEAISWHISQELEKRGVLRKVGAVQRITFTEITKSAVTSALAAGRQVSQPLVDAYMARRALDYLVGFHLSPVLWRKLPGARSAGRVQSVALRLVCEREAAIERFNPTAYWSIAAMLAPPPAQQQQQPQQSPTAAAAAGKRRGAAAAAAAVAAGAAGPSAALIRSRLTHADGRRMGVTDIRSQAEAEELARRIQSGPVAVARVAVRQQQRHPGAPFTTSTLQQEASRRLGFSAARTMRVAQQLYEGAGTGEGLITYMRTDGVSMSAEAVAELRAANASMFGRACVPPQPRQYKSRAKNAQEAHEAIRPTRPAAVTPTSLPAGLEPDQAALYELIWRRAVASQMTSAQYDVVSVDFEADGGRLGLRASGRVLRDPGYLRAYNDDEPAEEGEGEEPQGARAQGAGAAAGSDDDEGSAARENQGLAAQQLLALKPGVRLPCSSVAPSPHATRPPPRFTEASLVRALEERGIGRPSTYAPIMTLLQDRGYVSREGRALLPTSLGRVLTSFLEHYFATWVDYDFTSELEGRLDDVAGGKAAWRHVLSAFWGPFQAAVSSMAAIRTTQVFDVLDAALDSYLFPKPHALLAAPPAASSASATTIDVVATPLGPSGAAAPPAAPQQHDPRLCPKCGVGRLVLKPSRFGGFIGCSNFADEALQCDFGRPLLPVTAGEGASGNDSDGEGGGGGGGPVVPFNATERLLGAHPETGQPVYVRLGPYGLYVQQGIAPKREPKKKKKTKAAAGAVGEDKAAKPQAAAKGAKKGKAAATGDGDAAAAAAAAVAGEVAAELEAGPVKRAAIPKAKGLTIQTVTLAEALALLALPRTLGLHPADGQPVVANTGPFGPYVAHAGVSASLGKRATPQEVDLDMALALLAAKRARAAEREAKGLPPRGRRTAKRPAAPAKKAAATKRAGGGGGAAAAGGTQPATSPGSAAGAARSGAYTAFMRERWAVIKATDPAAVYREAVKGIAAEWRAMEPAEQARYVQDGAAAAPAAAAAGEECMVTRRTW
ncbi:hypothetical protein HYH02_006241 [Chlamydomonas schloesseri]|uniref:DNA topoisomerase n=1 Tax=Chlamydomonas schloesseri TaxID=2026947 RepID=A0A835WKD5_9CHLO|nr:hypothetical protein HYH02_006241 [Chlamydomonas schloesseri]|eukprot:KAG2448893.1 hypothetical protein HYH02_006241 [Chlamydomonas schloesseri]